MKKVWFCALSLWLLLLHACSDGGQHASTSATDSLSTTSATTTTDEKWYKRFAGTINGEPVVVMLHSYGIKREFEGGDRIDVGGRYYYTNDRRKVAYLSMETYKNDSVILAEQGSNGEVLNKWTIVVNGSSVQGRWRNNDKTKDYEIKLNEDYAAGSYALDIISKEDSSVFHYDSISFSLYTSMVLVGPSARMKKEDADFLEASLLQQLDNGKTGSKNLHDFAAVKMKEYIKEYNKKIAGQEDVLEEAIYNNHMVTMSAYCIENSNDLLVFQFLWFAYSGGMHGNFWITNVCIDMKNRKLLTLDDVLDASDEQVSALLDEEAKKIFELAPGEELSEKLLVPTIPPTDNIDISAEGITFYYAPVEIAGAVYGPIELLLPYSKLGGLLKPEFKQRMGL